MRVAKLIMLLDGGFATLPVWLGLFYGDESMQLVWIFTCCSCNSVTARESLLAKYVNSH